MKKISILQTLLIVIKLFVLFTTCNQKCWYGKCSAGHGAIPVRIGLVSGIAGRGDSSLIRPVPDAETLPFKIGRMIKQRRKFFISNREI